MKRTDDAKAVFVSNGAFERRAVGRRVLRDGRGLFGEKGVEADGEKRAENYWIEYQEQKM